MRLLNKGKPDLQKKRQRVRASRKRASSQKQGEREGSHSIGKGTPIPASNYFSNKNIDELALVRKFHNSVSAGPLYICTCCDQLWYKHSFFDLNELECRLIAPHFSGTKGWSTRDYW